MRITTTQQLEAIKALLAENRLPTDDLGTLDLSLFVVVGEGERVDAVGGLERFGDAALIRSIAVSERLRGRGMGRRIVRELESLAVARGIKELYLLTESAAGYFEALGYATLDRVNVPQSIRESRQFSALCPGSATVMVKPVGEH